MKPFLIALLILGVVSCSQDDTSDSGEEPSVRQEKNDPGADTLSGAPTMPALTYVMAEGRLADDFNGMTLTRYSVDEYVLSYNGFADTILVLEDSDSIFRFISAVRQDVISWKVVQRNDGLLLDVGGETTVTLRTMEG